MGTCYYTPLKMGVKCLSSMKAFSFNFHEKRPFFISFIGISICLFAENEKKKRSFSPLLHLLKGSFCEMLCVVGRSMQ